MPKIKIRPQKVSDAERFYEILGNPNFIYFGARPKSIVDGRRWLRGNAKRQKDNICWNYTIIFGKKVVGGIGVKINPHRNYVGEIGYFIDENYWGRA